jgi:hypothetical protein
LVPDGAHLELILLDAEGGLGLGQLDVGLHSCSSLQSLMLERSR